MKTAYVDLLGFKVKKETKHKVETIFWGILFVEMPKLLLFYIAYLMVR